MSADQTTPWRRLLCRVLGHRRAALKWRPERLGGVPGWGRTVYCRRCAGTQQVWVPDHAGRPLDVLGVR